MTSAPALLRYQSGTWYSLGGKYGPTGCLARSTPPYSTAASHTVTNLGALHTLLIGGTVSSGEVVEITDTVLDGTPYTSVSPFTGGSLSWAQNVLVRPPLGRRATLNTGLMIQTLHVTFAGFDWSGTISVRKGTVAPVRSGFWRCAGTSNTCFMNIGGSCVDCFLTECVQPYTNYGVDTTGGDHDAIHVNTDVVGPTNSLVNGCYAASRHLGVFPSLYLLDTTDLSPRSIDTTISGLASPLDVTYIRVNVPGSFQATGNTVTVIFKKNGVTFKTLTAPSLIHENAPGTLTSLFSDYAWANNDAAPYATFSNGDLLTVAITGVTGTPPRLIIDVGRPSTAHSDTFQTFVSSGGTVAGLSLIENVFTGSANSAVQSQGMSGLLRLSGNWMARSENRNVHIDTMPGITVIMDDNVFRGIVAHEDPDLQECHIEQNSFTSYSGVTLTPSNVVINDAYPLPPDLPDLTIVWPECPYIPTNPYGNRWH